MIGRVVIGALAVISGCAHAQELDKVYTVDQDGFCLAVTPVYGHEALYVQSDYHFAVQASNFLHTYMVEDYTELLEGVTKKRINTDIHWSLEFQSFNDFYPGSKSMGENIASSVYIKLSDINRENIEAKYLSQMREDFDDGDKAFETIKHGQIHGHNFTDMFQMPQSHGTDIYQIENLAFDVTTKHLVGFTLNHIVTGKKIKEYTMPADHLQMVSLPAELINARDTRLVGLRTTSNCVEAKSISSVQLIYFSLDQTMCDEVLTEITTSMMNEPGTYGPTCEESYLNITSPAQTKIITENIISEMVETKRSSRGMRFFQLLLLMIILFNVSFSLCTLYRQKSKDQQAKELATLKIAAKNKHQIEMTKKEIHQRAKSTTSFKEDVKEDI